MAVSSDTDTFYLCKNSIWVLTYWDLNFRPSYFAWEWRTEKIYPCLQECFPLTWTYSFQFYSVSGLTCNNWTAQVMDLYFLGERENMMQQRWVMICCTNLGVFKWKVILTTLVSILFKMIESTNDLNDT